MSDADALVLPVLLRARGLVAKGWTQGAAARREGGSKTVAWDGKATCFCALGAVWHQTRSNIGYLAIEAERALECSLPFKPASALRPVAAFNDLPHTTQADVLTLFDRAIERVRVGYESQ